MRSDLNLKLLITSCSYLSAILNFSIQITSWMNQKQFWIGLIDEKNDGNFTWESGLMLNSGVESYWANNQPKNMIGVGRRVCTHVNAQGKMNDITCGSGNNHAVCQKDMQGTINI